MKHLFKISFLFCTLLLAYSVSYIQMKSERNEFLEHNYVDYTLPTQFTGPLSFEFKGLASDFLLFKFMTFLGGRVKDIEKNDPRYWGYITESLDTITDLDPYFWDAYLFSEMFLAWGAGKYDEANYLLLKARSHIHTDYRIPYYLGFNYYYFQKDSANGSKYLMEASKLPGSPYYLASLAARLSFYSFEHKTGILFLQDMLKDVKDKRIADEFRLRISTLQKMDFLEQKITEYQKRLGHLPKNLDALVSEGIIDSIPDDPYGGEFIILNNGRVFTTSNMLPVKK